MPKLSSKIEHKIVEKLGKSGVNLSLSYNKYGSHKVYYSRKVGYFLQILDFEPSVVDGKGNPRPPSEFKTIKFSTNEQAKAALCCLNSALFYWFVTVVSDCRHVNKREVDSFPVNLALLAEEYGDQLAKLSMELMSHLQATSETRVMTFKHDRLTVQCIIPKHSKPIIDQIDRVLARHYGFTPEELDFIINYDIKYRMGRDALEGD